MYVLAVPAPSTIAVYCVAALALIVVPGPAVTYVVTILIGLGATAALAKRS